MHKQHARSLTASGLIQLLRTLEEEKILAGRVPNAADIVAAICGALGIHPDTLPMSASSCGRARAAWRSMNERGTFERLQHSTQTEDLCSSEVSVSVQNPEQPEQPGAPLALIHQLSAVGVDEMVVERLWQTRAVHLRRIAANFVTCCERGQVDDPNAFLTYVVTRRVFLYATYVRGQKALEREARAFEARREAAREQEARRAPEVDDGTRERVAMMAAQFTAGLKGGFRSAAQAGLAGG